MPLTPPIVPPLSGCVREGLVLTSVSLVCLVTVTEVQLVLTFTCTTHRFLLCKPQVIVDIVEKYKEKG